MQANWFVTKYEEAETSDVLMAICATEDLARVLAKEFGYGTEGPYLNSKHLQPGDRYSHTKDAWIRAGSGEVVPR